MKEYEIARFIPLPVRRKMVAAKYRYDEAEGSRVCATGRCPMGWLFADPPKGTRLPYGQRVPGGLTIARRIKHLWPNRAKGFRHDELAAFADWFTNDWDNGRVKSLRAALGVPK